MSSSPRTKRSESTILADIPLILWLVVVWGALWGDWSLGNLAFGLILSVLVTRLLALPPVAMSGRFNVFHFLIFVASFVWQVAVASFVVFKLALVQGPKVHNAIVAVRLRENNDLMMTAVGHTMALIPGSLVLEVDRNSGILYFHVLDVENGRQAAAFRDSALRIEASWIRIMGTRDQLAALRREGTGSDTAATGAIGSPSTQMHRGDATSEAGKE